MLGGLGGALDDASNILGGAQHDGSSKDEKPVFLKGDPLGTGTPDMAGAYAPEDTGVRQTGAPIEFIHFGYVHPDDSQHFAHTQLTDNKPNDLGEGPNSRAIMFRAALERESVLLNGFITSTQSVLAEKEKSGGAVGQLAGAVTDLVGGGGGGSSAAPKAADMNSFNDKVTSAASSINASPITYKAAHKTGIDLHQARANYRAFLAKLKDKPAGDSQPGLLSSVGAVAGSLPGVGGIFATISGIATKAFDIYVAFYTKIAFEQEKAVEKACHSISVHSIENNYKLIYPVWAPLPPDDGSAAAPGSGSSLPGALGSAQNTVNSTVQDVKDFLGDTPQVDCPGTAYLGDAFSLAAAADQPKDQPPPPPKQFAGLIADAFKEQIPSIPDFVITIIQEIESITSDFIKSAFQTLMMRDPSQPIDGDSVYASGRRLMLDRLVNLLVQQVSILQKAKNASTSVQGIDASADKFLGNGLDDLNKEFGSKLDPILDAMFHDFAKRLDAVRSVASGEKAYTMEAYLGTLPFWTALLFRDTFFPVWDILVDAVFGSAGSPVSSALQSASSAFSTLKGYVDAGRDVLTKANKVQNRWEHDGMQAGTGGQNLSGYEQDLRSNASRSPNPHEDQVRQSFVLKGRNPNGAGQKVTKSEWDAVKPDDKWESATPA